MYRIIPIVLSGLLLASCGMFRKPEVKDSQSEGTIYIRVDESFKPIMEEQIRVYQSSFPKAKIIATYKSEAESFNDLLNDSVRMVIATKKLLPEESAYYNDSLGLYPQSGILAYDAVALLLNRNDPDSVLSIADVQALLQGKSQLPYKPVFDGVRATSNVRFALDSILKGSPMQTAGITAAPNSWEVVRYIAANRGYLGFVGVSWIGNPEDPEQVNMLRNVRMAWLPCRTCDDTLLYTKPWQEEILTGHYPFTRGIYYIIKENYAGLGTAFVNFMKSERGQLIFRRGYLVPAHKTFVEREAKINLVKTIK